MTIEPESGRDWFVYLARCRDGTLYAGITTDLEARIAAHNTGKGAAYTRARLPVVLVYAEPAGDRSAALRREAAIKRMSRTDKLRLVGTPAAPRTRIAQEAPVSGRLLDRQQPS